MYLYCFKGARASNSLVALHEAGIKDVRMYFGSWNEWSRDPAAADRDGHALRLTSQSLAAVGRQGPRFTVRKRH